MPQSAEERFAYSTTTAAALIARAVKGDVPGVWALADEVTTGDNVREVLTALATYAAGYALAVSDLKFQSPESVIDLMGAVISSIGEVA